MPHTSMLLHTAHCAFPSSLLYQFLPLHQGQLIVHEPASHLNFVGQPLAHSKSTHRMELSKATDHSGLKFSAVSVQQNLRPELQALPHPSLVTPPVSVASATSLLFLSISWLLRKSQQNE